jgi:hypothetical protein
MSWGIEEALEVLRDRWGHLSFRKSQAQVMACIAEGDNVLAVLPTSEGKSACFQIPAVLNERGTIVVSPLIALMKDQVDDCIAKGVSAVCIHSHMDDEEKWDAIEQFQCGAAKLLYVAPERINSRSFIEAMQRSDVSMVVADEAHAHRADSLILTPRGYVRADAVEVGVDVVGFDHRRNCEVVRTLVGIQSRDGSDDTWVNIHTTSALSIGSFLLRVTSEHPVFVCDVGYVPAYSVKVDDEVVVQNVRTLLPRRDGSGATETESEDQPLLFMELLQQVEESDDALLEMLCAVADELPTNLLLQSVWVVSASRWFVAAHARGQSHEVARRTAEGIQTLEATGRPLREWRTWGKRAPATEASASDLELVSETVGRASHLRWERSRRATEVHQGGPRRSEGQVDRGGGRTFASNERSSGARSRPGPEVPTERVERVALLEPTSERNARAGARVYTFEVDGAHNYFADGVLTHNCCSQWGHQFRPEYMHIHRLITALRTPDRSPQVLMFTATATPLVVEDIVRSMGLKEEEVSKIVADPIRSNLRYFTDDAGIDGGYGNAWGILRSRIRDMDVRNGRHVIYCGSRKGSETVASICEQEHYDGVAAHYHAGMKGDVRTKVQDSFKSGETPIVCATTAFGMGIDVPNIRSVVLFGIPGSLEDFVQQTGRAGRDSLESKTILIADERAIDWQTRLVENENPPMLHYELAWEWLHRRLQPGETLKMSAADISGEITAMKKGSLSSEQVSVILNRMHAAALIERRNVDAGTPITVDPAAFQRARDDPGKAKPVIQQVWRVLWEKTITPALEEHGGGPLTVFINKKTLQEQAGVTGYMVGKALDAMEVPKRRGIIHVGNTFTGKSVRILRWRAQLTDVLPIERINEKRDNDFARLNRMVDYARLKTEEERKAALRAYFLAEEEAV